MNIQKTTTATLLMIILGIIIAQETDKKSHTLYLKQENHLLKNYYSPAKGVEPVIEIYDENKQDATKLRFKILPDIKPAYFFKSADNQNIPFGRAIEGQGVYEYRYPDKVYYLYTSERMPISPKFEGEYSLELFYLEEAFKGLTIISETNNKYILDKMFAPMNPRKFNQMLSNKSVGYNMPLKPAKYSEIQGLFAKRKALENELTTLKSTQISLCVGDRFKITTYSEGWNSTPVESILRDEKIILPENCMAYPVIGNEGAFNNSNICYVTGKSIGKTRYTTYGNQICTFYSGDKNRLRDAIATEKDKTKHIISAISNVFYQKKEQLETISYTLWRDHESVYNFLKPLLQGYSLIEGTLGGGGNYSTYHDVCNGSSVWATERTVQKFRTGLYAGFITVDQIKSNIKNFTNFWFCGDHAATLFDQNLEVLIGDYVWAGITKQMILQSHYIDPEVYKVTNAEIAEANINRQEAIEKDIKNIDNTIYTISPSDLQYKDEQLKISYTPLEQARKTTRIAVTKDFGVRALPNTDVAQNQVFFLPSANQTKITDYLNVPSTEDCPNGNCLKIDLKDKNGNSLNFVNNAFIPFEIGDYKGTVTQRFDNGEVSTPVNVRVDFLRFNTAVFDACMNTGLLDLRQKLNYWQEGVLFSSPDYEIVDKYFIDLDATKPQKGGIIQAHAEGGIIAPAMAALTINENIENPSFDEPLICGYEVSGGKRQYNLNDMFAKFPVPTKFYDAGGKEIKNGILETTNAGKTNIRFVNTYGKCVNNRDIVFNLQPAPADAQTQNNQTYFDLCEFELPEIPFANLIMGWNFRLYNSPVGYNKPWEASAFGAELDDKHYPNNKLKYPQQHKTLFAYRYDKQNQCLSKPLALSFSNAKEIPMNFKSTHHDLAPGDRAVLVLPEKETANYKNVSYLYTITGYDENKEIVEERNISNNFFEYTFNKVGTYDVKLNLGFEKSDGTRCEKEHTKTALVQVRERKKPTLPEPEVQVAVKEGQMHLYLPQELTDVYVVLGDLDGGIVVHEGYYPVLSQFVYTLRPYRSYLVQIFKGDQGKRKLDYTKMIWWRKLYSYHVG